MARRDVQSLIAQAVRNSDANSMRAAIEMLFAHGTPEALSPQAESELRHDDYVMEMPQSGERIRGRAAMRAMQVAYPTPPAISLRRVVGSGQVWVVEGLNDYDGDVWYTVLILELDPDGLIIRDTRYYAKAFEPPSWRAPWVESM